MIRAYPLLAERPSEVALGFQRLGLPTLAQEYLLEKLPQYRLLLTGLTRVEGRFLVGLFEASTAPGREEYPVYIEGNPKTRLGTGLLVGRREQFERLVAFAKEDAALAGLVAALVQGLEAVAAPAPLRLGERDFSFGTRTYVMGVVNVTPDSFSDGGRHASADAAIAHGLKLAEAGADILDVGGESTRPGSRPVSAEEELERVLPVVSGLRARTPVPLSVDTTKAAVAREVLRAGVGLINDISGFHFDAELPRVVAEAGAACCLMHMQGTPETMQAAPHYEDLLGEVLAFLEEGVARATAAGVPRERILVDPGIGFGKTLGHNLFLLRRLADLRVLGLPVLVGTSRKGFLGALTGGKPASERLAATLGSVAGMAALGGADVVRVHDVAEAKDVLAVVDAVRGATDGGSAYGSRGR
ncbi:dihydropteroate synthase [Stigmatella erecta]|uniref:Dihydropteroate synthase n=1 Tax=Stigmatella erecta TaxID=83460 RepID=A0A1H9YVY7_9BACT|nr:dihydropteroate synthase [Stigmatella erecta]SES72848.1 dihydropteroate synthase [Stigmatella erecta]